MKKFIITEELAQNILNFLANQPYGNVFGLVQGLQNLESTGEDVVVEIPAEDTPEELSTPVTE